MSAGQTRHDVAHVANRRGLTAGATRSDVIRPFGMLAADALALVVAHVVSHLLAAVIRVAVLDADLLSQPEAFPIGRMAEFGGLALALLVWLNYRGHHNSRPPFWIESSQVVAGCVAMLLLDGFIQFALKAAPSRLWLVQSWVLAVPMLLTARWVARRLLDNAGLWRVPTLVVAGGERGAELAAMFAAQRSLGYAVVDTQDIAGVAARLPWRDLCRDAGARFVVIAANAQDLARHRHVIDSLMAEDIPYAIAPEMAGLPVSGVDWHYFPGSETVLLTTRDTLFRPASRVVKVAFDLVVASLLFILLLPMCVVFAAIIVCDGGPVFYAHHRIGHRGKPFKVYKFRTMVTGADGMLATLLAGDVAAREEWEAQVKLRTDPRITKVGRFLRAFSLDELPQLVNVLLGQMSLVGPRPISPKEIDRFGEDIRFYSSVRPGITGLWQVSGRGSTNYLERVRLNTWYVKNWSLWLDIFILVKTIPVVLGRRGAY